MSSLPSIDKIYTARPSLLRSFLRPDNYFEIPGSPPATDGLGSVHAKSSVLCRGSSSIEQPENNTQGDQADKTVVAQSIKQIGQVWNNTTKELDRAAEKDLGDDCKGNQQ